MQIDKTLYFQLCDVFGNLHVEEHIHNDEIKDFDAFLLSSPFNYFMTKYVLISYDIDESVKNNKAFIKLNMKEAYDMFGIDMLWETRERAYQIIDISYYNEYIIKAREEKLKRIVNKTNIE